MVGCHFLWSPSAAGRLPAGPADLPIHVRFLRGGCSLVHSSRLVRAGLSYVLLSQPGENRRNCRRIHASGTASAVLPHGVRVTANPFSLHFRRGRPTLEVPFALRLVSDDVTALHTPLITR